MNRRELVWAALVLLALTGCGEKNNVERAEEPPVVVQTIQPDFSPVVAPLEGEALSPDGAWRVQLVGVNEDITASGLYAPEAICVVDAADGTVMWEDGGYYNHAALWSEDGRYLALALTARTWCKVTIIETKGWTAWDVTLPDGGGIPEYTFLPEDWGTWTDENTLRLTVGRGGDDGEQRCYQVSVVLEDDGLTGIALEERREPLPVNYDFDHDGTPDTVEVVTLIAGEDAQPAWYELRINGGQWVQEAHWAHVGWISIFALELDGQDYLLRYSPSMSTGLAYYEYELFSLNEVGEEQLYQTNAMEFDVNFGSSSLNHTFNPETIAAFLKEVHAYLDRSTLLLSTENFEFVVNASGADFWHDDFTGGLLRESSDWAATLREYQSEEEALRSSP